MKIHGSVVSLSFIFPHPPEDEKKKKKKKKKSNVTEAKPKRNRPKTDPKQDQSKPRGILKPYPVSLRSPAGRQPEELLNLRRYIASPPLRLVRLGADSQLWSRCNGTRKLQDGRQANQHTHSSDQAELRYAAHQGCGKLLYHTLS